MEEKGRADRAKELFMQGYNCAQSVAGAYADLLELPFETAVRLASGFGGGIGRLREVCGAMCGAALVLGAVYGYEDPKAFAAKKELYEQVQQAAGAFQLENGFLRCRDLLGLDKDARPSALPERRSEEYYKKRPCADIVFTAADILQRRLQQDGKL
ncbi:MAG: C-GCAxxG-C-C family protein [Oscillospiraceae bacterium]|nr:C-GCAxxG-C-C family protein [Oscillospiraceae bacterium]